MSHVLVEQCVKIVVCGRQGDSGRCQVRLGVGTESVPGSVGRTDAPSVGLGR